MIYCNHNFFKLFGKWVTRDFSFHQFRRKLSEIKRKNDWESVIGLEVHAQIQADSKLFSTAGYVYGAAVNTHVALFDAAIPGTLPVLNKRCVEAAVLTAMALECKLNTVSYFDRKHYFYADLPTGYQITQQRKPIANNGELEFVVYSPGIHKKPYYRKSKIRQLQLEQDSGKSLHDAVEQRSLIDLNRAGIALMEIVFEPDLNDGEEAGALVKDLILILQQIKTCNCKMEEGSLRVDANVSVNRKGQKLGTRTEIKNLSSIRSLVKAIEYEVERQIDLIEGGAAILNETRAYDTQTKQTLPMRDKEVLQDYRFMPEANLPPLKLIFGSTDIQPDKNFVNVVDVKQELIEMPDAIRKRLIQMFKLRLEDAIVIVNTSGFLVYYNSVMHFLPPQSGIKVYNFLQTELLALLNDANITFEECSTSPTVICSIIRLLETEKINYEKAKLLLLLAFNGDERSPEKIVESERWEQITDDKTIEEICLKAIVDNPKSVNGYRTNEKKRIKYFNKLLQEVNKLGGGNCHMKKVSDTMKRLLNENV